MSELKLEWNLDYLNSLIENKVQESLNLEYKASCALDEKHRIDITKDVSSFANSDGGIIIYGIREFDEKDKKHLPERIDPINPKDFSRERLEQIINLIRPKIEGLIIYPINLQDNMVAYVVDIPKSNTAHQANDKRYYKRYNFISTPMEDYEIRDINNRIIHPQIDLKFEVIKKIHFKRELIPTFSFDFKPKEVENTTYIKIFAKNVGDVLANYISAKLYIPQKVMAFRNDIDSEIKTIVVRNRFRDIAKMNGMFPESYHAARFETVLPDNSLFLENVYINNDLEDIKDEYIEWKLNADNAPTRNGKVKISDLYFSLIDETKNK